MAILLPAAYVGKLQRELSGRKESVYLIDGYRRRGHMVVRGFIAMANMARSSGHFLVTMSEVRRAHQRLRYAALGLLHSHRTGCVLSSLDRRSMAENPAMWIVASVDPFEIKAFALHRSVPQEIPIRLT
jgi:proteasome lid subunit RPN8/RPN11